MFPYQIKNHSNLLLEDYAKFQSTEAVAQRSSVKKVFLEFSQNSQENTCARVFFLIKLRPPATLLKKRLWHGCFPLNFAKFFRTSFFTEHLWWLPLNQKPFYDWDLYSMSFLFYQLYMYVNWFIYKLEWQKLLWLCLERCFE